AAERAGRIDHHEIDAERLPAHRARVRDRCGDAAAEHADKDGVADPQAETVGDLVLKRDERWALIVRSPPFALDNARPGRDIPRIGDAAVALQDPCGARW